MTTSVGTRELRVPRARVRDEETGETTESRSELLPRYARRTREVDEAILGTYLSGANSRRIRKALKPLLGEEHLSKSAVSRVVSRLKERFEEWQNRALSEEVYAIVYLDGFHLKVRMAKRVISVPVLVALGVAPDGQKRLLSLRLAVSEASTHWVCLLFIHPRVPNLIDFRSTSTMPHLCRQARMTLAPSCRESDLGAFSTTTAVPRRWSPATVAPRRARSA